MGALGAAVFSSILIAMVAYYYPQLDSPERKPKTSTNVLPEYDFIVIGAGTAGSVVASRLSEVSQWKVAIFEAGGDETGYTMTPLLSLELMRGKYDWNFTTVQQKHACLDEKGFCIYPRGKIMGGSSAINGMVYMRGIKQDFDTWEKLGAKGWSFKDVNPYFLKSENVKDDKLAATPYHRKGGPLSVQYSRYSPPAMDDIIRAGEEMGLPNRDYHGPKPASISKPQMNIDLAQRWSASTAFLTPARKRKNLDVFKEALVTKILIDTKTKKATGIEYILKGVTKTVRARKEVILSGGTIMSPKVLLLSGVGRKRELDKFGLKTIVDLPVGENFQDQTKVQMSYRFNGPGSLPPSLYLSADSVANFTVNKTGPLSTNGIDVMILYSTGSDIASDFPDTFCHVLFLNQKEPPENTSVISFYPTKIHVKSIGKITLKSKDPLDPPLIDPNYFSDKEDLTKTIEAMKIIDKLVKAKALEKYKPDWYLPDLKFCEPLFSRYDDFLECVAKNYSTTMYHPIGSVKMGAKEDPMTVLTPDLKVKGISNLRVIDASIMPTFPTGDPNAAVYMIGEKGADLIKKEHNKN